MAGNTSPDTKSRNFGDLNSKTMTTLILTIAIFVSAAVAAAFAVINSETQHENKLLKVQAADHQRTIRMFEEEITARIMYNLLPEVVIGNFTDIEPSEERMNEMLDNILRQSGITKSNEHNA